MPNKQKRRQRRLEPFNAETPLINLINPKHYAEYDRWIDDLRPMLRDPPLKNRLVCRLDFDFSQGFPKKATYRSMAALLCHEKVLRVDKNVLFRYLCSVEHSNLGVTFQTLKAKVNEALADMI